MIIDADYFERHRNDRRREAYPIDSDDAIVQTGELLGDRRRLRMLMALVDGQSWPAGDLARHAGIQPATASYHLEQLVAGGLLMVIPQGRHRYYRLASPAVAELLEHLAAVSGPAPVRSLRGSSQRDALRYGRTCYSHLAGRLGVAWCQSWVDGGQVHAVDQGFTVTERGQRTLSLVGIEGSAGTFIAQHAIDWTERVPHFAGPLAKTVTERLLTVGWIERGTIPRSIHVTGPGQAGLAELGIRIPDDSVLSS